MLEILNNKITIIITGIVLLLLIGGGVWWFMKKKLKKSSDDTNQPPFGDGGSQDVAEVKSRLVSFVEKVQMDLLKDGKFPKMSDSDRDKAFAEVEHLKEKIDKDESVDKSKLTKDDWKCIFDNLEDLSKDKKKLETKLKPCCDFKNSNQDINVYAAIKKCYDLIIDNINSMTSISPNQESNIRSYVYAFTLFAVLASRMSESWKYSGRKCKIKSTQKKHIYEFAVVLHEFMKNMFVETSYATENSISGIEDTLNEFYDNKVKSKEELKPFLNEK